MTNAYPCVKSMQFSYIPADFKDRKGILTYFNFTIILYRSIKANEDDII